MKAVIPCAKKEDQLFPLIESKPTSLMPVKGEPLVRRTVDNLKELGIEEIFLVSNYKQELLEKEFKAENDVKAVRQEEVNGTGNAVEECDFIEEDFIVVNGDVATSKEDLSAVIEKHKSYEKTNTVLASSDRSPKKFGVISIEDDKVVSIEEKPDNPENTLVNTGIYVFRPEIFDVLGNMEGSKDLTDAFEKLIETLDVRFELVQDYWIDVGSPEMLWKADKIVREHEIDDTDISEEAIVHEGADILGNVEIKSGAEIKPGTVIEGDVFIGEDTVLGPNTVVRDSSVCRESQLRSMDLESSTVFEKTILDPSSYIENCVIAEESSVKSNTTIRESFIGPRSYVEMNNSIRGVKFVPDARTDLSEISK